MATVNGLKGLLGEASLDAHEIQNENRTREMSLVITKIQEAELWLSKLE